MSMNAPTTAYSPMWGYLSAAGNRFMHIAFGNGSSQITESIKNSVLGTKNGPRCYQYAFDGKGISGFFDATVDAFKQVPNNGGLNIFSNFGKSIGEVGTAFKTTNGGFATKLKAAGGKTGSLVNLLLMVGFEIPNVWRAFTHKDGGVVTGTLETGKATLKLGASMAGFAVGSAAGGWLGAKAGALIGSVCGPVGSLVGAVIGFAGGMIGSMLTQKGVEAVVGKSFSEKLEQKQQNEQEQTTAMYGAMPQKMGNFKVTNPFVPQNYGMNGGYKDLSQIYREYMQTQQMIAQCGGYQNPAFGSFV